MVMKAGLPRRRLGRTGLEASALGVGGWLGRLDDPAAGAAVQEAAAIAAVRRAVELGVTYFDTSPAYGAGAAERHLGLGLRELSPVVRATLHVATKTGTHPDRPHQYSADATRWTVDHSLGRLFADHVDVLLVHDPRSDDDMDEVMQPGGALEALEALKAQGVVGAIGLGVRTHRFLRRAVDSGRFDVILTPYDYTLLRTSAAGLIATAAARDVGVINGSPYAAGLIAGADPDVAATRRSPLAPTDLLRARVIWRWCRERNVDLGALAMQFSVRNPDLAVTLAGPRTASEVEGNVRHAMAPLPEGIWEDLERLLEGLPPPAPGGEAPA